MSTSSRILLSLSVLFLSVAACSKDPLKNTGPSGDEGRAIRLELESQASLNLGFGQAGSLAVRAVYVDNGTPARDRQITFSTSGVTGGANLLAVSLTSDANGRVQNQISAGQLKASFNVVASTANAADVSVLVVVDGTYQGTLRVQYTYSDVLPLTQITTRIHAGSPACSTINLANPPANVGLKVATTPAGYVLFESLNEGAVFTVTATATSSSGAAVAVGCIVAPAIIGRQSVTAVVPLKLNQVKLKGTYDFSTKLHANEALPGELGDTVALLDHYLQDPAGAIAADLYARIEAEAGISKGLVDLALLIADGSLADTDGDGLLDEYIEDKVLDQLPQWVIDGITVGADVTTLITNMTVGGDLVISEANLAASSASTWNLQGSWEWTDFLFRWRVNQGCNVSDSCCGRSTFSGEEMGIAPIGAPFTGTAVRNATTTRVELDLNVPAHKLDIQYGKLVLAALNYLVLPSLTGQTSFACAMESLMGCSGPGTFVCNGTGTGVCGCAKMGEWLDDSLGVGPALGTSVCKMALQFAELEIENRLNALTYNGSNDSYFTMDIVGLIADTDRDLQTDLIDASNVGALVSGATSATPDSTSFTGDMYGEIQRTACTADNNCTAIDSCQVHRDVLDDCEGRTVCVPRVGAGAGGSACSQGAQCATGVCLGATTTVQGKCFSTCDENTDCPTGLNCRIDAARVSIGGPVTVQVNACGI